MCFTTDKKADNKMFKQAFDHITAPMDEYHIAVLRNLSLCAVLTFVFVIVGINQMIMFAIYLLLIALAYAFVWFYTLEPKVRGQVLGHLRDVAIAFWRMCVEDSFGKKTNNKPSTSSQTDKTKEDGWMTDSVGSTKENRESVKTTSETDTLSMKVDELKHIRDLSKEFSTMFQLNSQDHRTDSTMTKL